MGNHILDSIYLLSDVILNIFQSSIRLMILVTHSFTHHKKSPYKFRNPWNWTHFVPCCMWCRFCDLVHMFTLGGQDCISWYRWSPWWWKYSLRWFCCGRYFGPLRCGTFLYDMWIYARVDASLPHFHHTTISLYHTSRPIHKSWYWPYNTSSWWWLFLWYHVPLLWCTLPSFFSILFDFIWLFHKWEFTVRVTLLSAWKAFNVSLMCVDVVLVHPAPPLSSSSIPVPIQSHPVPYVVPFWAWLHTHVIYSPG